MSEILFSQQALQRAAASVRQSMLDSLPPPSQCEHTFSEAFQGKMERLLARARRREWARRAARRAALFFLAALMGVSAWLAVDTQARAAFVSWVREVYEEHIVYRFSGKPAAEELPSYRITWLPEGYEAVDVFDNGTVYNAWYQLGDDVMSGFVFEYFFAQQGRLTEMQIHEANYLHKTLTIHGVQADLYLALTPGETNNLIWVDENAGIVFSFNGFLEESVMLHIAESIVLEESTK